MRKSKILFSTFVILSIIITPFFTKCEEEYTKKSEVKVTVDPRIELLSAVQILSDYEKRFGRITDYDFPYKQDMYTYFSKFKKHNAVKLFEKMSHENFSYDAPPNFMLYLSNPPELEIKIPFSDYLIGRGGGKNRLHEFVAALRDFSNKTDFMNFFNAHVGTYLKIVDFAKKGMENANIIGNLEDYFGMQQHSYTIILAPLFHPGGYGATLKDETGKEDVFSFLGPKGIKDGFPSFGNQEDFLYTALHEFSHSFVNPTTDKFEEQIQKYSSLYEPLKKYMTTNKTAYDNWELCVNEHIIRAITTRLTYIKEGEGVGLQVLNNERNKGFFYLPAICDRLKYYETHRKEYPTFEDFYPEIINVFKELSEKKLDKDFFKIESTGIINEVLADRKSLVLIVPTNEIDPDVQNKINEYVQAVKNQFFPNSPIITDKKALTLDLSSKIPVIYGTIEGNLWLKHYSKLFPFKIKSKKIIADKEYKGTHLRLISSLPNPQNPENFIVVYTAQKAEDVDGINAVMHGPTQYVIAEDTKVLKADNYKKKDGKWTY